MHAMVGGGVDFLPHAAQVVEGLALQVDDALGVVGIAVAGEGDEEVAHVGLLEVVGDVTELLGRVLLHVAQRLPGVDYLDSVESFHCFFALEDYII